MNELEVFCRLAQAARREVIPRIDVTTRVLQTVQRGQQSQGVPAVHAAEQQGEWCGMTTRWFKAWRSPPNRRVESS